MYCNPEFIICYRDVQEFLLVAEREKIARYDLVNDNWEELPITGLKNVIAIEYDIRTQCVYWADIVNDTIAVSVKTLQANKTAKFVRISFNKIRN